MTILEQKFMEVVPGLLRRIAENLESISEQLKDQNGVLRERLPKTTSANSDPVDYGMLEMEVARMRIKGHVLTTVTDALFSASQHVGIKCAMEFSKLYGGIGADKIRNAILSGKINGHIPEMKDVECANPRTKQKMIIKTTEGRYNIELKSLVLWLEQNGRRTYGACSTISKCIDKIINT